MARKALNKKKKTVAKKSLPQKAKKKITKKVAVKRKKKVSAIPQGYYSITPYLIVKNATAAIEFYKKAFAAKQVMRLDKPDGKVAHAELKIGNAKIMLAEECPEMNAHAPQATGGSSVSIHLYVKNVDSTVNAAAAAGAKVIRPVDDMFYGDRCGVIIDPHGHTWCVATHIEDVSLAKMKKRAADLFSKKL